MMETVKREWQSIDLPKALFKRISEIIRKTGNVSVAEYVRFALQKQLQADSDLLEEIRIEEKEIKERLQD